MTTPVPDTNPPEGLVNLRDLADMPTVDGSLTRAGVLYRSDAPYHGDPVPEDVPHWPPRVVIDLRDRAELLGNPHPLADQTFVRRIALLERGRGSRRWFSMSDLYLYMVREAPDLLAEVFRTVLQADGSALVHCAAGKDRTGVVSAMLLAAVGVRRDSIVADYLHTDRNMLHVLRRLGELPEELPPGVDVRDVLEQHSTPVEAIEAVLDHFDEYPDGVLGWLRGHGITTAEIDAWQRKFLQD